MIRSPHADLWNLWFLPWRPEVVLPLQSFLPNRRTVDPGTGHPMDVIGRQGTSLRRFPAATQPYRQRQECFRSKDEHVPDQSTNIASSVPDQVYGEKIPLSPIFETFYRASSYRLTRSANRTTCTWHNRHLDETRHPATHRMSLFSHSDSLLLPDLSLSDETDYHRPPTALNCSAAIDILGSFSCSKRNFR